MTITVNGKEMEVTSSTTVLDIMQQLGVSPERAVAEVNGVILGAEALSHTVQSGDVIELVRFVGGG